MPKSITGSVGLGGSNLPQNVMIVQYLLNCIPANSGGPTTELAIDGIVGPKTIAAIQRFQRTLLNFADGRVDPGGKTLKALQPYDPYPNVPLIPTDPGGGGVGAKQSGGPSGLKGGPPGVKWPGEGLGKSGGGGGFGKGSF
jgi:peptidoglycan hydrolase-like protein with peptidoglycan-binding domain